MKLLISRLSTPKSITRIERKRAGEKAPEERTALAVGLWSARLVNVGQLTRWRHSDLCRALLPRQGERRGACAPRNTRDRDGAKGGGGSFSSAVRAAAFRYERTAPRAGSLVLVLHVPPRRERSLSASARHRSLWIYRQPPISDQRHQAPLFGTSIGRVETATVVALIHSTYGRRRWWVVKRSKLRSRGLISWFCFPKFWFCGKSDGFNGSMITWLLSPILKNGWI